MNRKAININVNFKNIRTDIANKLYKTCHAGKVSFANCLAKSFKQSAGTISNELPKSPKLSKTFKILKINRKINKIKSKNRELQSLIDYDGEKKYFQAPFENLRDHLKDESYLTQVSVAVIMQAMIDCTAHGEGKCTKKIRKDAREWIFNNGPNFRQTCIEAKILPEFVINKTKELIGITGPNKPSNQNMDVNSIKHENFYQYKMKQKI